MAHEVRRRGHAQAQRAVSAAVNPGGEPGRRGRVRERDDPDRPAGDPAAAENVRVHRDVAPARLRHAERRDLLRAPPGSAGPVAVPAPLPDDHRRRAAADVVGDLTRRLEAPGGEQAALRARAERLDVDEARETAEDARSPGDDSGRRSRFRWNHEHDVSAGQDDRDATQRTPRRRGLVATGPAGPCPKRSGSHAKREGQPRRRIAARAEHRRRQRRSRSLPDRQRDRAGPGLLPQHQRARRWRRNGLRRLHSSRLDQRAVAGIQPRQCHRTGNEPGHEHCSGANQGALCSPAHFKKASGGDW